MKTGVCSSYIYAILSAILFGFIAFGGKLMSMNGFSLVEVLVLPGLVSTVVLAIITKCRCQDFLSIPLKINLLYGFCIFVTQVGQFAPLFLGVSVSLVVFLLYMQPLWTILINVIVFKAKFSSKDFVLIALMLLGLVFLLAPWQKLEYSLLGVLLAALSGLSLSGWVVINGIYYNKINNMKITFITNFLQVLPFVILYPLISKIFPDPSISSFTFDKGSMVWGLVALYAIFVFVFAQIFFYAAAKKIHNMHLGMILLLEPVVAAFLDIAFLGTNITWNMLLGGGLILSANAVLVMVKND